MIDVVSVKFNETETNEVVQNGSGGSPEWEEFYASRILNTSGEKRTGPGIMILKASEELLYQDRRAWGLCSKHAELTPVISAICGEVRALLQEWTDFKGWEQLSIKRVIGGPGDGLLLSALGLPDRHGLQDARILITVEEVGKRGTALDQAKELFHLTEREINVVENLMKGWTNKEIGNALGISEQTVKEHMKHVMAKTKTTTRTGILVRVLGL
jgi:DNA-binding CsgD family transcriptional regulator